MIKYVIERLFDLILVALGVLTIVFIMLHLSGDPTALMIPSDSPPEHRERLREVLGFNDPLIVQYGRFLKDTVQGNFGQSLYYNVPAFTLVLKALPATIELTVAAFIFAVVFGLPAGIIAAIRRNSALDTVCSLGSLLGQSMPTFWLGILMILLFSVELKWLPTSGRGNFSQLIMPSITLGAFSMARITRLVRSSMLEVLGQDYIKTARSKGLAEIYVIMKHALKNASISVVTIFGLTFGALLGGAVITETIFSWPGVGRLVVDSIFRRDYPVVQAGVFYLSIIFVLINLIVDLSYKFLDPRIRLGREPHEKK